ncbi:trk system potassium uptake protein TrkA [Metamycoplasma subdolum]|uniref:Trk system potassium uptake protein TrkA n=1 Tax=Metamycoplasma subdolum TaxID=92407 RepID=A0A3M0A3A8_9BACT|nr:TrkA family potassium uptake protein [Metamycoplasma subdolum]RMA79126.1 trk system potassium uptake protein TrkA [Metamycoplasma subdolum]WPB50648.1 TrkA family potassium uptake protein [Metamycoplasma subdolum]
MKKIRTICIIGVGRFGSAITEALLADREHKIRLALLDKDEKVLSKFKDDVDEIYVADTAERKTLEAVNIDNYDVVIAASSDNIEIVAALSEIGVKKIIARATSKRHANVLKQIGVSTIISPEEEAGERVALLVANPSFLEYSQALHEVQDGFVVGSVNIKNPKFFNTKIKEINVRSQYQVNMVLVKRGVSSYIPDGDFVLQEDDIITMIGEPDGVTKAFDLFMNIQK